MDAERMLAVQTFKDNQQNTCALCGQACTNRHRAWRRREDKALTLGSQTMAKE